MGWKAVFRGVASLVFCVGAMPLHAVDLSLRPVARQDPAQHINEIVTRALAAPLSFDVDTASPAWSLRPRVRPAAFSDQVAQALAMQRAEAGFSDWVRSFRPRALAAGISPRTFRSAFFEARYLSDIIARDRDQSEFTSTIWDYLDRAVSDTRIASGRDALTRHGASLARIEAHYGVEKEVVAAVWGMETNYGSFLGKTPTISALATLAYDGRRGAFFERQLIDALRILQAGDVTPEAMRGSWAGAMGHTQFMPTSYLAYAVDFTGDGRRDVWSDDPTDALASTAAYLREFGWVYGMPWGVEVRVPRGFDFALAQREIKKMPSDWAALGVRDMTGRPVRDFGAASLLLPAGADGPAFLVFKNFDVIKRYNASTSYAMGVGHLADRLRGAPAVAGDWPRSLRPLTRDERKELQARLTARGFDTGGVDGRLGSNSLRALRAYQRSVGLPQDGYAHGALLDRLR